MDDFKINAGGTLNLLEAVNKYCPAARIIYSSTNKVYGDLEWRGVSETSERYYLKGGDETDEDERLDFYSPYGCSKGAADQYMRDYSRIYQLDTVVVRQSCIYGPYQLGTEDQGWLAWFTLKVMRGEDIVLFGTGKQVRDVLHVDDLVDFYIAIANSEKPQRIYNIGGGIENTTTLLGLIELLDAKIGRKTNIIRRPERPGDQKVFVSGNKKASELGWEPTIGVEQGVSSLISFFEELYGEADA